MAATDTVVGIVGAVVLAAVMVGVFVYEYNNAPGGAEADPKASFADKHPSLNATGDLDGDGKLNYLDDDLDNDGLTNTVDTDTVFAKAISGTVPQSTTAGTSVDLPVKLERGLTELAITVTWDTPAPTLNPALATLTLTVEVFDASGTRVGDASTASYSGSTGSATVTVDGAEFEPGSYTVRVSQGSPRPSVAFSGEATLNYGAHQH